MVNVPTREFTKLQIPISTTETTLPEEIEKEKTKSAGPRKLESIRSFIGHVNERTVKEVSFFGSNSSYVISGSDNGLVYFWNKKTAELIHIERGDSHIVNCLAVHPLGYPFLAVSGIDDDIKVLMPVAHKPKTAETIKKHSKRLLDLLFRNASILANDGENEVECTPS